MNVFRIIRVAFNSNFISSFIGIFYDKVFYFNVGRCYGNSLDRDWETKLETPVLAISGSSVGNANTYECTLTFNLPQADLARRNSLTDLQGKCLQVMMLDTNGTYFVMGISGTLTGGDGGLDLAAASHIGTRPQTFARLSAIEGGTGAAFSDESVLTVT